MSSIFTFNHSPPKPASPWSGTPTSAPTPSITPSNDPTVILDDIPGHLRSSLNSGRVRNSHQFPYATNAQLVDDRGMPISTLSSEPAIGATEYKLSLAHVGKSGARREQLITQLLWRLQQSSAYHGTSTGAGGQSPGMLLESHGALYEIGVADDGTFVGIPEKEMDESLDNLRSMAKDIGATVEIIRREFVRCVTADDEERAKQKRREHIKAKLRARGKNQQKMRMRDGKLAKVPFDDAKCEEELVRLDAHELEKFAIPVIGTELWVVEALVRPGAATLIGTGSDDGVSGRKESIGADNNDIKPAQELRVSLTGPTTSGKSTLLGALTTGELDNGRGKLRLSLLRHHHEIISGITSSIAWEIFGYKPTTHAPQSVSPESDDNPDHDGFFTSDPDDAQGLAANATAAARLVNYSTGNVSSWTDIHASVTNPLHVPSSSPASPGRIVFISDSAGHTKYRHTTIRSLVGWAPHYIVLLIPANDADVNCGANGTYNLSDDIRRHFNLCLLLKSPLVVLFTKIEVAAKSGFTKLFSHVLGALKQAGRKPITVADPGKVDDVVNQIKNDHRAVPVLFTSAVRGDGIATLHELLMRLPVPSQQPREDAPKAGTTGEEVKIDPLFHIEEFYDIKPIPLQSTPGNTAAASQEGIVISGHLKSGTIAVGDILTLGPFSPPSSSSPTRNPRTRSRRIRQRNPSSLSTAAGGGGINSTDADADYSSGSGSASGSDHQPEQHQQHQQQQSSPSRQSRKHADHQEWRKIQIVSIRHLRLPVTRLREGEAGTIGIVPIPCASSPPAPAPVPVVHASSPLASAPGGGDVLNGEGGENGVDGDTMMAPLKIHRGMVLLPAQHASRAGNRLSFTISIPPSISPSSAAASVAQYPTKHDTLQIFVASVRSTARVVDIRHIRGGNRSTPGGDADGGADGDGDEEQEVVVEVHFTRENTTAWVEVGERVVAVRVGGSAGSGSGAGQGEEGCWVGRVCAGAGAGCQ
ncbi:hypothetical protein EX30DRAFT_373696 [Ascodesmis nigricans]|uniref:Tr-type G domain-containing protein n=1 Tax=Ascodesmis nigricans TaxID=341454 RepID=A0A4S2MNJ5_9PEZI|nr:hypothetical protein EX30DRAFT_373696 [Ascodesmis nigricans]